MNNIVSHSIYLPLKVHLLNQRITQVMVIFIWLNSKYSDQESFIIKRSYISIDFERMISVNSPESINSVFSGHSSH